MPNPSLARSFPRTLIVTQDEALARAATEGAMALHSTAIERVGRFDRTRQAVASSRANLLIADADPRSDEVRAIFRQLRTPNLTPSPHIVIVTVCDPLTRREIIRAIRLGIDLLIVGPLTARVLIERYQALLRDPPRPIEVRTYIGPDRRRAPDQSYVGPDRRRDEDRALAEPSTVTAG